jgi:hypothetical protein
MGFARPLDLLLEEGTGFLIFPWFGHHREHDSKDLAGRRFDEGAGLRLHQCVAVEREAKRAPAHGRVLGLVADVGEVGQGLVPADVQGAEDDRPVAGGREDLLVEPLLPFAARKSGGNQKLELGAEQADAVGPCEFAVGSVLGEAGVDEDADLDAV